MAYDEALAHRVRDHVAGIDAIAEKRMFGGIAFLLDGNMSVGVHGDGLIVRVGPEAAEAALARPHARVFDMTGRPMKGWVMVDLPGVEDDDDLAAWIERGLEFARSLPPKG
jgi:TfoX/Sxy family transcriptional regulator of competence genes